MNRSPKESRQQKLLEHRSQAHRDRVRLIVLCVAFAFALFLFLTLQQRVKDRGQDAAPAPEQHQDDLASFTALPPVDQELLEQVRDAEPEQRVLIEAEPFAHLAKVALALLPGHLRVLGEPELPFAEIESRAAELRGRAFRLRGALLDGGPLKRSATAPEEYWAHLRTDQGQDFFYASLRFPEESFEENYWRADGFFYKLYTQTAGGERLTAPLLVGRGLARSYRPAAPATEPDLALLSGVRDHALGEEAELDQAALWQLLNVAKSAAGEPQTLAQLFAAAPTLSYELLADLAKEPTLFRGKPMVVLGRIPNDSRYRWSEVQEENPLRLDQMSYAYLGNTSYGDHPIHLIAPGDYPFAREGPRLFYAWFLQMKGYIDNSNRPSRTPVFIVAGEGEPPVAEAPAIVRWITIGIVILATLVTGAIVLLARRDRRLAEQAAAQRRELRRDRERQGRISS